jgi:uncharacterized secreted protein with C-terminal beta-propeller domain
VQESDIVKTDGRNIYVASQGDWVWCNSTYTNKLTNTRVSVVAANNGEMKTTAAINFTEAAQLNEMLLFGNKLIIIWSKATEPESVPEAFKSWGWRPMDFSVTVEVYDTRGNFTKPVSTYTQDGMFHSARMIDNHVYLITNFRPNLPDEFGRRDIKHYVPGYLQTDCTEKNLLSGRAIILPEKLDAVEYTVISGLDVTKRNMKVNTLSSLGSSNTIYASLDNIYISRDDGQNWWWWNNNGSFENHTIIDRFSINKGKITHTANTRVKGTVRNQFHFDEYDGVLRVVTEVWGNAPKAAGNNPAYQVLPLPEDTGWWREQNQWRGNNNNWWGVNQPLLCYEKDWGLQGGVLYTLDENLDIMAQVHRIGFGEQVHAVRFMGDRAYIVTFWQTDPLFSFDLSDPKAPKLLGELKIPGFSRYLHSWEDGLLLGIGVDTNDDGIRVGLKMTMFDVADDENLIEKHVQTIGAQNVSNDMWWRGWAHTPIENDHRAALICADKNIIGIPYMSSGMVNNTVAYAVYSYSAEAGFRLLGEITVEQNWNSRSWTNFQRGMFIGDYVYAIADNLIVSAKIGTNSITEAQRLVL